MLFILNNNLIPFRDNKILYGINVIICAVLLVVGFMGSIVFIELIVMTIVLDKKMQKDHKKILTKVHKFLSTKDFSEIALKKCDDNMIPLEKFVCKAKLNKDGNIVYNISLNFESETDDYENFLKHFEIDNTDKINTL